MIVLGDRTADECSENGATMNTMDSTMDTMRRELDKAIGTKEVLDFLDNIRLFIENEVQDALDERLPAKMYPSNDMSDITYMMREVILGYACDVGVVPDGYEGDVAKDFGGV